MTDVPNSRCTGLGSRVASGGFPFEDRDALLGAVESFSEAAAPIDIGEAPMNFRDDFLKLQTILMELSMELDLEDAFLDEEGMDDAADAGDDVVNARELHPEGKNDSSGENLE